MIADTNLLAISIGVDTDIARQLEQAPTHPIAIAAGEANSSRTPLVWQFQGPGTLEGGQAEPGTQPNRQVNGAIEVVLPHPTDANILYVGAINGGVWKTTNATAASPTWTPLTDSQASLSIGGLAFDRSDPTFNTLVAANGRFSSLAGFGGALSGMLRSTDGGNSWSNPGSSGLTGANVTGIAARGANIVVSSFSGIRRSTDGGATFNAISAADFNAGNAFTELTEDPSDPSGQRLYAASIAKGIYRSDDFGATWTKISGPAINAAMDTLLTSTSNNNTRLAVHPTTGRLYATILISGQPRGIFYTSNGTTASPTWTQMDVPVLPQGSGVAISNVSGLGTSPIVITSVNHGLSTGNSLVISGVTGNTAANGLFWITRIDADSFSLNGTTGSGNWTGGGTWTKVVGVNPRFKEEGDPKTGGQGSIHFSMVVDPTDENIVYIGGDRQDFPNVIGAADYSGSHFRGDTRIARNSTAIPSPQWDHLGHDIVAFDPTGGTANGTAPHADSRDMEFLANGNLVEVDDGGIFKRTNPRSNTGDWSSLAGNLGVVEYHSIAYDTNSNIIIGGTQDNGTHVQRTSGATTWDVYSGGDGGAVAVDNLSQAASNRSVRYTSFQFLGGFRRTVVGANNAVVSSTSPALTVTSGSPLSPRFYTPVAVNNINGLRLLIGAGNGVYESTNQGDSIAAVGTNAVAVGERGNAIDYGGRSGGVANEDVAYVAGGSGGVYVRTTAAGPFTATSPGGSGSIVSVKMDPEEWHTAFANDSSNVYWTINAGAAWSNITGNLASLGAAGFLSLEFVSGAAVDAVLLGTNVGVFASLSSSIGTWFKLGDGLPNAPVWDLDYDAADDVLVAGTLGRSAWSLSNVAGTISPPGASIQGQKWNDLDNDGVKDAGEPGLQGWTIYLDENADGQRVTTGSLEPDNYDVGTLVNNIVPGATLTAVGGSSSDVYAGLPSGGFASTGTTAFTRNGPFGWGGGIRLRIDFSADADFVSIDAISDDALDIGILQAYDASGNLLATDTSANLAAGAAETLSIARTTADIAYVIAGGFGGDVINLDNLHFVHTDPSTVTSADGSYSFVGLDPGVYLVREEQQPNWTQTAPGITTTLSNLAADSANIAALVPTRFNFSDGEVGTNIVDGGNDMYDGGNFLNTNLASAIPYTNSAVLPSDAAFGPGSQYFTAKYPGLFVLGATNISINSFQISGNNGADGAGTANGNTLSTTVNGRLFTIYFKRVFGTTDPSINHIIMVPGDGAGLTHTFPSNTDDDSDTVSGLSGVGEIYYALVSRQSGGLLADADILNIANALLENVSPPGAYSVSLATDQVVTNIDFGNHAHPGTIEGQKWRDVNGNGVQDAGDSPLANWTVYLDDNNNGILDEDAQTTASTDVPKAIADSATVASTISVSGQASIHDVNVTLDITHTYDADLTVTLVSPSRTRVQLFSGIGGSDNNFQNTTLDDEAATAISSGTAPFAGVFRPQNALAAFDGENPNGVWTLEVRDGANGDVGTLNSWSLSIASSERSTTTDASGLYSFAALAPGDYIVREVEQPDWRQTYPTSNGEYGATGVPFNFEDISSTGQVGIAPEVDDAFFVLTPAQLAGFSFELFGATYDTAYVSSNGLVTFGSGTTDYVNTDLRTAPAQAAIAAFWDDLVIDDSESPDGALLWEVRGTGDDQRLILQWHNIRFISGTGQGAITFQAILNESDGSIHLNYLDLVTTGPNSQGASATVGVKNAGNQGNDRLLVSFNSGPNAFVGSNQSVVISPISAANRVSVGPGQQVVDVDFGNYLTTAPLPGDYNRNGEVDAADYALWRHTLGSSVAPYDGADGSGNGIIDQADHAVWRAHFGETLPPAAATNGFAAVAATQLPAADSSVVTTVSPREFYSTATDAKPQAKFELGAGSTPTVPDARSQDADSIFFNPIPASRPLGSLAKQVGQKLLAEGHASRDRALLALLSPVEDFDSARSVDTERAVGDSTPAEDLSVESVDAMFSQFGAVRIRPKSRPA